MAALARYASFRMPFTNAANIVRGGGYWASGDINLSAPSTWTAIVFDPGGHITGYSGLSVWINGNRVAKLNDFGEIVGALRSLCMPAITTGFVGTVSSSGTTITFSAAADAAAVEAGTILVSSGQTLYIVAISGLSATALAAPSPALSAATITSLQTPIFADFNADGVLNSAIFADGTPYYAMPVKHRSALMAMQSGVSTLTDGATIAVDWNNGATQMVTLGGTGRTITFSNAVAGQVYRLAISQDATGIRTITTWPEITWMGGGTAPVLTTTANKTDIVTLLYAGNNTYYGDCRNA